jgi:hypothetical protein
LYQKKGIIEIPEYPPSSTLRTAKILRVELEPSSFITAVEPKGQNVLILGDISGSMGAGNQMDVLRKSFDMVIDRSFTSGWKVALAGWDHEVDFWDGKQYGENWITKSDLPTAKRFVQQLKARGSNNMNKAISVGLSRYPSTTDCYVMCDGDVSPFRIDSWKQFRACHPSKTFHFIALGKGSDFKAMQEMATVGGGVYWESN